MSQLKFNKLESRNYKLIDDRQSKRIQTRVLLEKL